MRRSTVVIDLEGDAALARDLAAGGVFVPGCSLRMAEECELVVCAADRQVALPARVVYVDPHGGAGLELIGFSTAMREQLAELSPGGQPPTDTTALRTATLRDDAHREFDDDLALPHVDEVDREPHAWPEASAPRPPAVDARRGRSGSSPSPFDDDGPTWKAEPPATFGDPPAHGSSASPFGARLVPVSRPSPFDEGASLQPSSRSALDDRAARKPSSRSRFEDGPAPPASRSPFDEGSAQPANRPSFDARRAPRAASPSPFDDDPAPQPSGRSPFDDGPAPPASRSSFDGRRARRAASPSPFEDGPVERPSSPSFSGGPAQRPSSPSLFEDGETRRAPNPRRIDDERARPAPDPIRVDDERARRTSHPAQPDDHRARRGPDPVHREDSRAQRPSGLSLFDDGPPRRTSSPALDVGPPKQRSSPALDVGPPKRPSSPALDVGPAKRTSSPALDVGPPKQRPKQTSSPALDVGSPKQTSSPALDIGPAKRTSSPALLDDRAPRRASSPALRGDSPRASSRWPRDGRSGRPASVPGMEDGAAVPLAYDDDARTIPVTLPAALRRDAQISEDDDLAVPMAPELERVLRRWTGSMDSDPLLAIAAAEADPAFFDASDEQSAMTYAEPVRMPELDARDGLSARPGTSSDPETADLALDDALAMLDAWPDGPGRADGDGAGAASTGAGRASDRGHAATAEPGHDEGAEFGAGMDHEVGDEVGDDAGDDAGHDAGDELGDGAGDDASTDDGPRTGAGRPPRNVHERLRGLSLAAQLKLAASGELPERVVLERLYGKNVWETLLRNPRLTPPEVARIARYGSLPRVLLDVIVGNNTWLQVPEVRRALLCNPRLGADQIVKVLRVTPKHELRLAAIQTAYPPAVRTAARTLLRSE